MDSPNSAAEPEIRPATSLATAMARLAIKAMRIVRLLWPSAVLCSAARECRVRNGGIMAHCHTVESVQHDPRVALPPAGQARPRPGTAPLYDMPDQRNQISEARGGSVGAWWRTSKDHLSPFGVR